MSSKKCQNRRGMRCIRYKGQNKYYRNPKHLADQLNINPRQARKLIRDNGRRIVIGPNDKTLLINIKNENFTGLLKEFYSIGRINNKKIVEEVVDLPRKDVAIVKQLNPDDDINVQIIITVYISFPSPGYSTLFEILTDMGKEFLTNKILSDGYDYDIEQNIFFKKVNNVIHNLDFGDYYYFIDNDIENEIDENLLFEEILGEFIKDRQIHKFYHGPSNELSDFVLDSVERYMQDLKGANAKLVYFTFRVGDYYKNRELIFEDSYVREFEDVFELTEWTNLEYNNENVNDSCAVTLIKNRYPELYWDIKKIETTHGVKINDFLNLCIQNKIGYKIYDEHAIIKYENNNTTGNLITALIFNNHIYPINGGKPKRYSSKEFQINIVDDSFAELKKYMIEKKLPSKIKISPINNFFPLMNENFKIDTIKVTSFILKNEKFICNSEYEECLSILQNMGYEKYIYDNIRLDDIPYLLEKILKVPDVSSFIPEMDKFKTSPLLWKTNKKIIHDKLITIDKNKSYSYSLYSLPYLIRFDYRKNAIIEKPLKIVDWNLYIAKPKYWSILMPKTKIYPGYFLSECKDLGFEFELLEELQSELVPNYYRQIINLMFKYMEEKPFKNVMNKFIGKFERNFSEKYTIDYVGIYNNETTQTKNGFVKKIGKYNLIFKENKNFVHVRNRLPIATQIKDMSRMLVYLKIKDLTLKDDNIVQINTDSITYYGKHLDNLDPDIFSGWKSSIFKEIGNIPEPFDEDLSALNIKNNNTKQRVLHMNYAGSGKTTYIIEKLIPKILNEKLSYVVLTPTHKTLEPLKKLGINCEIMQKYVFANTIPKEDYVIVDEIGFVDRGCHDLLYKISKSNKNLESFGDFNQLPPVGEDKRYNQPHYLKYLFNEIKTNFVNYRNNFTKIYYDQLINSELDLIKEVNFWSCKNMFDAEYILCYRCKKNKKKPNKIPTKTKYNNLMLEHFGFKKWNDIGVKIVCKTNNLLKDKIYNHKVFIINKILEENNEIFYILIDENKKLFSVLEKKLFKNFEPGYAINIHQAQGMTLKSYYWAPDDNIFINGNTAYTIISRLKQKTLLNPKYINRLSEFDEKLNKI